MIRYIDMRRLHTPLKEAGLVPENCRVLDISIGVSGALAVRYEVMLTSHQLVALGEVFQQVGREVQIEGKGDA